MSELLDEAKQRIDRCVSFAFDGPPAAFFEIVGVSPEQTAHSFVYQTYALAGPSKGEVVKTLIEAMETALRTRDRIAIAWRSYPYLSEDEGQFCCRMRLAVFDERLNPISIAYYLKPEGEVVRCMEPL